MPEATAGAPRPFAGDLLPPGPSELLRGLSEGDASRAAAGFGPGAVYAAVANETDEVAPRAVLAGQEIGEGLAADPRLGRAHQLRVCCVTGDDCLLEGWILGGGGERTRSFAASIQLDAAGLISRCLMFRTPAVEDAGEAGDPNRTGADIRRLLDEYFEELQASRFEAATANYSEDCLYSHPPYSPGAGRAEFHGRDGLLAGFEARGPRPARIFIDLSIQRGADLLLEGHALVDGTPAGPQSSFVSSASLDAAGKIRRYVAFQCKGLEPRRGAGEGS